MKKYYLIYFQLFIGFWTANAQYKDLFNFNGTNGTSPYGSLLISNGKMYGTTYTGGANGEGCIFRIDTNGNGYKDMHDFAKAADGENPSGSLILSNGVLYGMTQTDAVYGYGTLYSIDTSGAGYSVKYYFSNGSSSGNPPAARDPQGSLIISSSYILYGITYGGGAGGYGCVFSINTGGAAYTDLHDFGNVNAGAIQSKGALTLSGSTLYGVSNDSIFSINTNGTGYKHLYKITASGENFGSLTLSGSVLYGMPGFTGANSDGCVYSINTNGTGYTDLFDFNGANGQTPTGCSVILIGSKLYGMTRAGGANSAGVIFSINTNGTGYTDLFDFNGTTGQYPEGSLTLLGSKLYGLTSGGGTNGDGVIFSFDTATNVTTSINNINANSNKIKVYPNPNNGCFSITQSNKGTIRIYNMLGEEIFFKLLNAGNSILNLSDEPKGIYLYRLISDDGEQVYSGKLIIE